MGVTPDKYLEILTLLGFLTPSAIFSLRFDPGVGAGELPALRAVVTGRVPLVAPGFYPAFPSPPHFAVFGRGGFRITAFTFRHKWPTTAFWCADVVGLSCAVGGAQIGSQGVIQRIELRGEIWLHLSPVAGVAAGGKYPLLRKWGGWCRDCCPSISFHGYQNSCLAPQ